MSDQHKGQSQRRVRRTELRRRMGVKTGFRMIECRRALIEIGRGALRDRSVMIMVVIAAVEGDYMHLMEAVIVMRVRRSRRHHAVVGEGDHKAQGQDFPQDFHEISL